MDSKKRKSDEINNNSISRPSSFNIDSMMSEMKNSKKPPIKKTQFKTLKVLHPPDITAIDFGIQQKIKDKQSENLSRFRSLIFKLAAEVDQEKKRKKEAVSHRSNHSK